MSETTSISLTRRGLMLVVSSPSGAGKTTLARRLLETEPNLEMSVSATTRPKRTGEVEGKDYRFVDRDAFTAMSNGGEFLEWAVVFNNHYGTPKAPVMAALAGGRDVLFDIDWQGAGKLRDSANRQDVVTVFILPPTATALEGRLRTRAQDSDAVVRQRMNGASNEIQHWNEYDYVVVNEDLDRSLATLHAILEAERSRRERLRGLPEFVQSLQTDLASAFDQAR